MTRCLLLIYTDNSTINGSTAENKVLISFFLKFFFLVMFLRFLVFLGLVVLLLLILVLMIHLH